MQHSDLYSEVNTNLTFRSLGAEWKPASQPCHLPSLLCYQSCQSTTCNGGRGQVNDSCKRAMFNFPDSLVVGSPLLTFKSHEGCAKCGILVWICQKVKNSDIKGCILLWAPESLASDVHRDVILGVYCTFALCIPTEWLQCKLISVDVLISSIREAVRSWMSLCRWISIPPLEQLNV